LFSKAQFASTKLPAKADLLSAKADFLPTDPQFASAKLCFKSLLPPRKTQLASELRFLLLSGTTLLF
jgi:hypothetical protein